MMEAGVWFSAWQRQLACRKQRYNVIQTVWNNAKKCIWSTIDVYAVVPESVVLKIRPRYLLFIFHHRFFLLLALISCMLQLNLFHYSFIYHLFFISYSLCVTSCHLRYTIYEALFCFASAETQLIISLLPFSLKMLSNFNSTWFFLLKAMVYLRYNISVSYVWI